MPRSNGKSGDTKAVILLDACMSTLDRCRPGCEDDINILCKHRFKGNVRVIACNGFASFMRLTDSQIVLYFLWPLMTSGAYRSLSDDCRYMIITKDKHFYRQAQREWMGKMTKMTVPLVGFEGNEIMVAFKNRKRRRRKNNEFRKIVIEIVTVQCSRNPKSSDEEISGVIDYVNRTVFRG